MATLLDLDVQQLKTYLLDLGEKPYRAGQIFSSLHSGKKISEITEISKQLRERLLQDFCDEPTKIIQTLTSKDGTQKHLLALEDGNVVECVVMNYKYGNTICVSTQVGCRMGCAFCASTLGGLVRNLSAGEILSQVLTVNRNLGGTRTERKITNVVLMGSGEPLDNYANVIKFIRLLSSPDGINVSPRNVSLSTCGLVDKMRALSEEGLPVNLTVSLHSPFDEEREKLMPVAKKYKISEILAACDEYFKSTGRRFYFEYSLVRGVNDTDECVEKLVSLLKGRPCHVNLIRLNEVKERDLLATCDENANKFLKKLTERGLSATLRRRMGADIDGACGQLRRRYLETNSCAKDEGVEKLTSR